MMRPDNSMGGKMGVKPCLLRITEVDQLVYELYGLIEKEIKIVEEATK